MGSKWGYVYVGDWRMDAEVQEVKDLSADTLRRQAIESGLLLGRMPLPYQIHSATPESGVFDDRKVIHELARLRGLGWELGFTTTGPRQADTIRRGLEVRVEGEAPFSTVQATWNVLEPSAGPALSSARRRVESHEAGVICVVLIIAGDVRQTGKGVAGINSEDGIEVAALGRYRRGA